MGEIRRKPGIGDQVQITGFLGEFEAVQIRQHGLAVDLKHLGLPKPDYIERDIPTSELIYPNPHRTLGPLRH
jgi:hypothetical protein